MDRSVLHFCLKGILALLVYLLLLSPQVFATHIRAGEITIRRLPGGNSLLYEFTFTGYRDRGSIIEFGGGTFRFGDGATVEQDFEILTTPVNDEIEKVEFVVQHNYQAPGPYIVSYEEEFRNADILNMDNSVNTTFYVESYFEIDPFIGGNEYPRFTTPPIDFAAVGALFIHNPGAVDDGDSLAYRFVTPKQSRDREVNNYRRLNHPEFYSNFSEGSENLTEPILSLDPLTGDLVWNAPGDASIRGTREYNVAFRVEEWRNTEIGWILISYVTRDMQIIVEETDNERPNLLVPDDICVAAGDSVNVLVEGNDPDQQPVKLEAFGGPFEVASPAVYTPDPAVFQGPPGFLSLEWETVCGHVRMRPYEVQFKVTDNPETGPRLVNFETFQITVVGPAPTGLTTSVQPGKSMRLTWDSYQCSNAETMEIWRRVGAYEIEPDECVVGMPPDAGYELVDRIDVNTTEYLDNNHGKGLSPGAMYCYRLVAQFPDPRGGKSYVSEESCDSLIINAPVIANVDVVNTSETDGEIFIKWAPPYQIDQALHPPAYTYDLFRGTGFNSSSDYELIAGGISDTIFTDTGLNTFSNAYNYYVRFYDNGGILVDSSVTASSVELSLRPLLKAIEVNWSADVPWSIKTQEYPYHYIYRDQVVEDPAQLVLIDSVDASSSRLSYLDDGRFNDLPLDEEIEYCYFVTTQGSYDNDLLPAPLINRSQVSCAQPNDTIPPCRPPIVEFSNGFDCSQPNVSPCSSGLFSNSLSWTVDQETDCGDDLSGYNIYFSETGLEEDYELIALSTETQFTHNDLNSFKGCYRIAAVDRSGNESELTDPLCNDNCPVYILPNVFTPNDDDANDVFTPLNSDNGDPSKCPRFVLDVAFRVFDRSGTELFRYESFENPNGIFINWDGKNHQGQDLPAGTYYYVANVTFDLLDPDEAKRTFKGWVQILR